MGTAFHFEPLTYALCLLVQPIAIRPKRIASPLRLC